MVARYMLCRPRLGVALLLMTPVVDLVLITATVIDLRVLEVSLLLIAVYLGHEETFPTTFLLLPRKPPIG